MERGMEYGMERQTVKKIAKFRLENKKDTCFDLFSLRTAARKEWRAVVECETVRRVDSWCQLVQAAQPKISA